MEEGIAQSKGLTEAHYHHLRDGEIMKRNQVRIAEISATSKHLYLHQCTT